MDLIPSAARHRRLTLAVLMAASFSLPPASTARAQPGVAVDTAEGPVVGVAGDAATAWKGIPFAAPPVGGLRWRPPAPALHRSSPLDATAFGPACPQSTAFEIPGLPTPPAGNRGAEDCLQLNIWAPNSRPDGLAVMFWIHGGGMIQGSGTDAPYDGATLAASENVVVVTTNYRLGALGFLAHSAFMGEQSDHPGAGNYGLLDQIAALRWVKANIAGFGGDPGRVTIFGESAGGVSVCALLAAPAAAGLFQRGIMESGNCSPRLPSLDPATHPGPPALRQGDRFAEAIGCAEAADVATCLRAQPVDKILATLPGEIGVLNPTAEVYGPIVDGTLLAETPGEAIAAGHEQGVPFILGANADEATIFTAAFQNLTAAQYEALVRLTFPEYADRALALYPASAY
ncbi:MAG: carboxylesterase/lipase family protein, partial [Anaerolineae bacterium]